MSGIDKYRSLFIEDTRDNLDAIFKNLERAREIQDHGPIINEIFRLFHSIKGASAAMGIEAISSYSHALESYLQQIRDENRNLSDEDLKIIEEGTGALEEMLSEYENTGSVMPRPTPFERSTTEEKTPPEEKPEESASTGGVPVKVTIDSSEALPAARVYMVLSRVTDWEGFTGSTPTVKEVKKGWKGYEFTLYFSDDKAAKAAVSRLREWDFIHKVEELKKEDSKDEKKKKIIEHVKVDSSDLDSALKILGDILFLESSLYPYTEEMPALARENFERMRILLKQLRDVVLQMNLVPFETITATLHRTSRELCRKLGKKVKLVVEGGNIRMDRHLLTELSDPLIHLLRNAIDHGIEKSEEREKAGKEPTGLVKISAYSTAGWTIIEVSDDGRGMNRQKILEKAVSKSLISPGEAETLTDEEVFKLTCTPGFSSREEVSDISGRGVGMDVVANAVEKLHGVMEIHSEEGKGTTIKLKLPSGAAIVQAAVFRIGPYQMGINADRLLLVTDATSGEIVKETDEKNVYLHNGIVARIFPIRELLGLDPRPHSGTVLIVDTGKDHAAIYADEILGTAEIYIKPLKGLLKDFKPFFATTVSTGGEMTFIIDHVSLSGGEK